MDYSVEEFIERLASAEPAPGGGGASALAGAMGASLCAMAARLTSGKKKFAEHQADIEAVITEADMLSKELYALIDRDRECFLPLAEAYSIPKDAPERNEVLEKCLRLAASVPMDMLRASCRCIALHDRLRNFCSALVISDVATGAVLAWSAMYGAAMNVRVNTHLMKDREYAENMNREVEELMGKYWKIADDIYETVYAKLG